MNEKRQKFERNLKYLHFASRTAKEHYKIWQVYEKKDNLRNYKKCLDNYSRFFEPSRYAHFVAMLMAVGTIIDQDGLGRYTLSEKSKKENYGKFIKLIEDNQFVGLGVIKEVKKVLNEISPLTEKMFFVRSKHFAHIELGIEDVLSKTNLKQEDCNDVIEITTSLINKISSASGQGLVGFDLYGGRDLYRLLENTEEKMDSFQKSIIQKN